MYPSKDNPLTSLDHLLYSPPEPPSPPALSVGNMLPDTLPIEYTREFLQMYGQNEFCPLPDEVLERIWWETEGQPEWERRQARAKEIYEQSLAEHRPLLEEINVQNKGIRARNATQLARYTSALDEYEKRKRKLLNDYEAACHKLQKSRQAAAALSEHYESMLKELHSRCKRELKKRLPFVTLHLEQVYREAYQDFESESKSYRLWVCSYLVYVALILTHPLLSPLAALFSIGAWGAMWISLTRRVLKKFEAHPLKWQFHSSWIQDSENFRDAEKLPLPVKFPVFTLIDERKGWKTFSLDFDVQDCPMDHIDASLPVVGCTLAFVPVICLVSFFPGGRWLKATKKPPNCGPLAKKAVQRLADAIWTELHHSYKRDQHYPFTLLPAEPQLPTIPAPPSEPNYAPLIPIPARPCYQTPEMPKWPGRTP